MLPPFSPPARDHSRTHCIFVRVCVCTRPCARPPPRRFQQTKAPWSAVLYPCVTSKGCFSAVLSSRQFQGGRPPAPTAHCVTSAALRHFAFHRAGQARFSKKYILLFIHELSPPTYLPTHSRSRSIHRFYVHPSLAKACESPSTFSLSTADEASAACRRCFGYTKRDLHYKTGFFF